ncbi:flavodoxin family protein [Methanobacterium sp. ACI-7]|uniref:flavodoxin family protein n=1 Tax=unclassified Methanobacterium TaxID=2627676 RepID=UPI0039C16359
MPKILGISGSAIENSNTELLIKAIMDASGLDQEFIKLSDINVGPCRQCRKCAYTNECIVEDDFKWLSKKVMDADAIVLGSPTIYRLPSAFIKAFVERLYSKRHVKQLLQGKIGAAAAVGWMGEEFVCEWLHDVLEIAGMEVAGGVFANGTPGCFVCGPGETCLYSIWNSAKMAEKILGESFGLENIYEGYLEELPDNDPFNNPSYRVLEYISVRDQPEKLAEAKNIGEIIKDKLMEKNKI